MNHKLLVFEKGKIPRTQWVEDPSPYFNIPTIIIDPDLKEVQGVQQHFWKQDQHNPSRIVSMDDEEKEQFRMLNPDICKIQHPKVIVKEIIKEVVIEKIVDRIVEVPVQVVIEVIREVPVEKILIKEVVKIEPYEVIKIEIEYKTPLWNWFFIAMLLIINAVLIIIGRYNG